ncbi:MAG: hypothetical protein ACJ748_16670, partial [Flavisolibacter sp.]
GIGLFYGQLRHGFQDMDSFSKGLDLRLIISTNFYTKIAVQYTSNNGKTALLIYYNFKFRVS